MQINMIKITTKDKRLLYELWKNSRLPSLQIAKRVGLSREVVEYRIKRLVNEKVIRNFSTFIDNEKLGFSTYYVNIQLQDFTEQKLAEIIAYLKDHEFVKWVAGCSGKWDIIIVISAKDKFHFDSIFSVISDFLGRHLRDYEILVRLGVIKDAAIGFIRQEKTGFEDIITQKPRQPEFDLTDLKILSILNKDPRARIVRIAEHARISADSARLRIKKLESQGIIRSYRPLINIDKLGYIMFMIFLEINVIDSRKEKELITFFNSIPNIHYVEKYIGQYPLSMQLVARNNEEFYRVLIAIRNKLSQLIKSYELVVVFEQHKQESFPKGILRFYEENGVDIK